MRYLKVTLIIGFLVSLVVGGLFQYGAFRVLDTGLGNFLGLRAPAVSSPWTQYPAFILFAFGIAWTTIDIPRNSLKILVAIAALAQVVTVVWVLNLLGRFFSPFPAGLAIVLAFTAGFIYAQSESGSRKRIVRALFGERISKKVFHALVNTNVPLQFEGELREATVVVCEIFNHDQLADALPVRDYVAMNNSFLRNAAEFLVERGGYLDECDGESLRVVFGTPLPDSRHAATASIAALDLLRHLDEVNRECRRVWKETFDFRIGVNSGELVVAAYGSRRLGAFSVAGEPVEWARRLCSANLIYGSRILAGSITAQQAEDAVDFRPVELIQRHPTDAFPEEVYELMAPKNTLSDEELARRDHYWRALVFFREEKWDEALAELQLAYSPDTIDGPLEFYMRRIEQIRSGTPALDWKNTRI